jgi:beta-mannosidase
MTDTISENLVRLASVRPLVRYVDEEQAVVEIAIEAAASLADKPVPSPHAIDVLTEVNGGEGFHDEQYDHVELVDGRGKVTFSLVQPERWWPAGMGEQSLYELQVSMLDGEDPQCLSCSIGLTSVRRRQDEEPGTLWINGRRWRFHSYIPVDRVHQNMLLPVSGQTILVVRDHYGPDVLYEAADRAGVLMIQCVPIDAEALPERQMAEQVRRLSSHPSLAGWFVGHHGRISRAIEDQLRLLDPVHSVFSDVPSPSAA